MVFFHLLSISGVKLDEFAYYICIRFTVFIKKIRHLQFIVFITCNILCEKGINDLLDLSFFQNDKK